MAQTARDIVHSALVLSGVKGRGMSVSAEDVNDTFTTLNDFLAILSTKGMVIPVLTKRTGLTLVVGQSEYTVAPDGNFNIATPVSFAELIVTGTPRYLLEQVKLDRWLRMVSGGNAPPSVYFYERGTLRIGPAPDTVAVLEGWVKDPLAQFANLNAENGFGEEYVPFLKYNLAVWICGGRGRDPRETVVAVANDTRMALEMRMARNEPLQSDLPTQTVRDISTY